MNEKVEIYDIKTGKISVIDKEDLGENMILVHDSDSSKTYWVNKLDLIQNEYQHPPFSGDIKNRIISLMEVFLEVSESKSYEEWEDNFRRDENPEREIRIWEYIADKYILYSKQFCSIEEKEDLYYLLLTCSSSEKELVLQTLKLDKLSVDNANIVINSYFSNK